jgi:UDP-glucose 4-epimerase
MQILITGVAGLIGSRLADYIIENTGHKVIGIDDLSGGYIENVNQYVKFFNLDLSKDDISVIFEKYNIDVVYHFACYAAEGLSPFMRNFNYRNNILATTNIVNNCINYKVKRLVYASSMSVYGHGKKNGEIFDETLPYAPIDPYAVSKMA